MVGEVFNAVEDGVDWTGAAITVLLFVRADESKQS